MKKADSYDLNAALFAHETSYGETVTLSRTLLKPSVADDPKPRAPEGSAESLREKVSHSAGNQGVDWVHIATLDRVSAGSLARDLFGLGQEQLARRQAGRSLAGEEYRNQQLSIGDGGDRAP